MSKKIKACVTSSTTIADFAGEVSELYSDIVNEKLFARAEVVLADFARKDDERLQRIASLNNQIAVAQGKLDVAEKVSNQAALTKTIAYLNADVTEIVTLRNNAKAKREAFISKFETDAYAALVDSSLVREELNDKIAKAA